MNIMLALLTVCIREWQQCTITRLTFKHCAKPCPDIEMSLANSPAVNGTIALLKASLWKHY